VHNKISDILKSSHRDPGMRRRFLSSFLDVAIRPVRKHGIITDKGKSIDWIFPKINLAIIFLTSVEFNHLSFHLNYKFRAMITMVRRLTEHI
jgi:hypothetical protein